MKVHVTMDDFDRADACVGSRIMFRRVLGGEYLCEDFDQDELLRLLKTPLRKYHYAAHTVGFPKGVIANADLKGWDLRHWSPPTDAVFRDCDFTGADLTYANFTGAWFERCVFSRVDMDKVNVLYGAQFLDCTDVNIEAPSRRGCVVHNTKEAS